MQTLDVDEILDRGLRVEASLSEQEWPIFAVAYLESVADMEGWDFFFIYRMEWCPLIIRILKLSGDFQSLRILENYRKHYLTLGVDFTADQIDRFLQTASDTYFSGCCDWREEFTEVAEIRWALIAQHYRSVGINLQT
ncbi:hypothetical protein [uncultured Alteromonas sp.]|jgi:hypothetical protein|uniref:hypothetical protein n=1 Tax=uncultured Alteromonas sp. TaxID=179113 RepID=UPI0025EFF798|nr:hypothetical protein [uncultured Alteromonas sp.]